MQAIQPQYFGKGFHGGAVERDVALISAQARDASDKGISGVPTYVFAQKYAVSGAQPAEQLARAIREVSAEVNAQAAE